MTSYDKCKQYLQEEKGLSLSQSLLIIEGLKDFVDVDAMTIQNFDYGQMREILCGLRSGVDVSLYSDVRYTVAQMEYLRKCLEMKMDVSEFADPNYSIEQMQAIMMCKGIKLDPTPFKQNEVMAKYADIILKYYPAISLDDDFSWLSYCEDREKISYILEAKATHSFRDDMLHMTTRELTQEKEIAKRNSFYDELLDPHRLRQFNLFDSYE